MQIIYEDNHIIVVNKKPMQASQKDSSNDYDLQSQIKDYLIKKYDKKGDAYLGIVHRLDRPVGGIMVYAKTSKAASRISKQIREQEFEKTYIAVVEGYVEETVFKDKLSKNRKLNKSFVDPKNGKKAKLIIEKADYIHSHHLSRVRINLITGRSHQIRVQFSSRNLPLWGDAKYNPNHQKGEAIALWAKRIAFKHPTTNQRLEFISPVPDRFPFNLQ